MTTTMMMMMNCCVLDTTMALFNRAGNIVRQTVRLARNTDDSSLREAFSKYGEVSQARVIKDRETGMPRGFGFVIFTDPDSKSYVDAILAMDQWQLDDETVSVSWAKDRRRRRRRRCSVKGRSNSDNES
ncbi:hypothetical protein R6Q57_001858 [Mikania cordata]